jgi:hypothetical protein
VNIDTKTKTMWKLLISIGILIFLAESCSWLIDETPVNKNYLPLIPGTKYTYSYSASKNNSLTSSVTKGESLWEVISVSKADHPLWAWIDSIYTVRQTFNGYKVNITYSPYNKDSILVKDQISNFYFMVGHIGLVDFSWEGHLLNFQRYNSPNKADFCFTFNGVQVCLREDVGIAKMGYDYVENNESGGEWLNLVNGPAY